MSPLLITAIVCMFSALGFYSIGVWSEKISGRLKVWHTVLFWIGLVFDTTGTTIMTQIAGKMDFDMHGITGALAIVLMLGHAVWAVGVLLVTALLIVPAATARNLARSASGMFWWAVLVGISSAVAGLLVSAQPSVNVPTGAAVVLCATLWFGFSAVFYVLRRAA